MINPIRLKLTLCLFCNLFSLNLLALSNKTDEQQLISLADSYYSKIINFEQPYAYFNNFQLKSHDKFISNRPEAIQAFQDSKDIILLSLKNIDSSSLASAKAKVFYAKFTEYLEASKDVRQCRTELWDLSHMFGAHTLLDFLAAVQPLETKQNKIDALVRWSKVSIYYQQEKMNLNRGLNLGYSAPKRVVKRLIDQLKKLTNIGIEEHPFMQLTDRTEDEKFTQQFKQLLSNDLLPSIRDFVIYLEQTYIRQARDALGLHSIPNGRKCYMALYRSFTTLKRTPEEVYDIGYMEVAKNKLAVIKLGKELYAQSTFESTIAKANNDKSQQFESSKSMHQFFEKVVKRSKTAMPQYFLTLPSIEMEVKAIPVYQQGSGRSAHYNQGSDERKATFFYDPSTYPLENFGNAEILSVHEGYPGHHMQIALVQNIEPFHPVEVLFENAAYAEGWARYAESLAEEAGIYRSKSAKILRRTWPARGMVADTAMHILGLSNAAVAKILSDSGMSFSKAPDIMMDRMAAMPAQLTAYDSGALEIFALRKMVEQAKGDDFDIKQFHHIILKNGNVPLAVLREQVVQYINDD